VGELSNTLISTEQLVSLSEVLNEVMSAIGPEDKTARQELAVRLARLLLERVSAGVTDYEKLKTIIHSAATRTFN
jgi:tRNA C32,U32 (ribose-2'-O)-methylase TrmJ